MIAFTYRPDKYNTKRNQGEDKECETMREVENTRTTYYEKIYETSREDSLSC